VTNDGKYLVAVCHEKKIRIYDLEEMKELGSIQETESITSLCLSGDDKYALVNLSSQEIHLWNLHEKRLVRKYMGQKQGRFVIRSSFGGLTETFVVSGSEDSKIYVWNREHALLLDVLTGHSATVNSVAAHGLYLASASDDKSIRIWCT
jgi:WD40 repeat protein